MKKRKLLLSIISAAMALVFSGCSFLFEDEEGDSNVSYNGLANGDGNGERYNGIGATTLSVSSGNLGITRREREQTEPMGESGWTILVYLCGTDLESNYEAATIDISEAIGAKYNEDVRIVYQTGGTSNWSWDFSNSKIERYVNIDGNIEKVGELPAASMGNSDTLADFVSWGVENYPAAKMGLVFWNHGGGSISGVCFDELYDSDSLSLREIDSALNSVYDKMTDKFEFIGFDACLMSTLETANILVPYARYMFASEETEPGGGWNYTDIMNFLADNPNATGDELGKMHCPSYYQHCIDNGDSDGTTFAIIDLSKLDDLLISFDKTSKEIYENSNQTEIARAIYGADNFGGNNRSEGYTNMVDLKGMLNAVKPYASNASDTLRKLEDAIVCSVNGPQHKNAGGLSLYYPLAVQGSQELSIFSDVCTSCWYLGFVDRVAYGTTGGDVSAYDNSMLMGDCDDLWSHDYSTSENIGANNNEFCQTSENSTVAVEVVYFDEDGTYTVKLSDMDEFNYATCSVFAILEDSMVYLGEDDEVIIDYDNMILQDSFDGSWVSIGDIPLAIEAVMVTDELSVYTAPILLNGTQTNLRIEYDWNTEEWNVIGAWAGIDAETGAAARETVSLKNGDVITPLYMQINEDGDVTGYTNIGTYTVNGKINIDYKPLFEGDYSYSMTLYDVYGNCYYTQNVTFSFDENGDLYFDPDELA